MAALELLRRQRTSVVGASFVIDLPDLQGSRSLQAQGLAVHSLLDYPGH
jgi:adenine phosphoribosyltransferase